MTDRKITREAAAAETELLLFAKRELRIRERCNRDIEGNEENRLAFIEALPADVRKMLVAGGVIGDGE